MTETSTDPSSTSPARGTTTLRAVRVLAGLSVLSVCWQFVTAGQLFPRGGPLELHSAGAVVLHVLTGLTAVAAGLHWRVTRGPAWLTVLAVVVFVLSFVQAYFGDRATLWIHIPGALILTVGAVWLLVWAAFPAMTRPDRDWPR